MALRWVQGKAQKAAVASMEPIEISGRRLRFSKQLGEGGFAIVYLCKDDTGRAYA